MRIIDRMTVGSYGDPLFKDEEITLVFDDQVNVFIGPNACGKTTLLRSIAARGPEPAGSGFVTKGEVFIGPGWEPERVYQELTGRNLMQDEDDWDRLQDLHPEVWQFRMFPWAFLPATRVAVPALGNIVDRANAGILGIEAYVNPDVTVGRMHSFIENGNPFDDYPSLTLDSLLILNTTMVENVVSAMFNHFRSQDWTSYVVDEMIEMQRLAGACAREIASEIIVGQPGHYASIPDGIFVTEQSVHPGMGLIVKSGANSDAHQEYVGHLSAGTQGVYLWILYVALKIALHFKFESGWEKRPAILLIDEIENHLHPTWQRRVIPALLDHLPGLQIFATTHSPFVVAGLKAGQVHLLNRDANGVVTATPNTEDIVGWTADEILRTMMGVQDPTDDETARNAVELRQLRDEGPRATPEGEEQRQAEMQRLRRLVNRDLLAGGPREAQRELFEQQFGEALEKYLQSQDLNQDNG